MDFKLLLAILLSILPVSELRGGLPLAIVYATQHQIPIYLVFSLIVLTNILAILIAFYFLDNIHKKFLLKIKWYKNFFNSYIEKLQKKVDQFESKYSAMGFLALTIFVAIPLPGTGAWTGCIISWLLDLDRKKSILSIAIGVLIAGILMLLGTLGFMNLFS
jgi:uncharacterized membrane protein